tara:strand:+ start:7831 stop:8052 length:222 start_codon:yes stop_codon:yes gene_type:complete
MSEAFDAAWSVIKYDIYGVCPLCGFDAEEAVRYQIRQNIRGTSTPEDALSPEEYADEVDFYLYHHQCPARREE